MVRMIRLFPRVSRPGRRRPPHRPSTTPPDPADPVPAAVRVVGTGIPAAVGVAQYGLAMTTSAFPPVRLKLESVNFDAADPEALAGFWAGAIGGTVGGRVGRYVIVFGPEGGHWPNFLFQEQPGRDQGRNSVHIDLGTDRSDPAAEVERLIALGASRRYEVAGEIEGVDWTTLADPEGNLFCVGAPPPEH
jgi:hypothetical protein